MTPLKSLLNNGVLPEHDLFEINTIRAVNILGVNAIVCLLVAVIYGYFFLGHLDSLFALAALPFFFLVLYFNKINRSYLGITVLFISSAIILGAYSIRNGEDSYTHSMFILNIMGLALLYRSEKARKYFYSIFIATLLCLGIVLLSFNYGWFEDFRNPMADPSFDRRINFLFLFVCSLLFSFVVVISYKQQNRAIEMALEEHRVLLAEVNHRVKNNLAIIISLLNLQKSVSTHPETEEALQDIHDRVMSMALVHNKMYNSEKKSSIDIAAYITELIHEIRHSIDIKKNINFKTNIEPLKLEVAVTIPLGLILNELITNAIKHAFPDKKNPVIAISLKQKGDDFYELIVEDNGVGTTKDLLVEQEGLGINLIQSLAEQIEAKCFFEMEKGLKFFLLIPVKTVGVSRK